MKILIDLDKALAQGNITLEERDRLKRLAGGQTSDLALGILIGFGVIASALGFLALSRSVETTAFVGLALGGAGAALVLRGGDRWRLLGQILLVVGSVLFAAGIVMLGEFSQRSILYATAILCGSAILADNGLLAALAVLALSSALGASSGYQHARYTLVIERPAETVAVFTGLALLMVFAAPKLPHRFERLALIAARAAAILVNFGFLIGSLWGDEIAATPIHRGVFALAWAAVLLGAGLWAWRENRRWPLITATVFAALHFYTQWFERLGADPLSIMVAGLSAIVIGYGLKQALAAMPPTPEPA